MKLDKMPKEELELYSYEELTKLILEESKTPLNTPTIFKKICELLDLSDDYYADKIGDFYTSLTTDKDFVLLDDGNWDLRDHHPADIVLNDDEDDDTSSEEEAIDEKMDEDEDGIIEDDLSDDDADDIDIDEAIDEELTIVDEDDLEQ